MNEYESMRRVCYKGGASFVPVCEKCGRFVKADETIRVNESIGLLSGTNATCKKCGRIEMLFEGFIEDEEGE
jgi:RNase P subunit RPR2